MYHKILKSFGISIFKELQQTVDTYTGRGVSIATQKNNQITNSIDIELLKTCCNAQDYIEMLVVYAYLKTSE